MTGPEFKEMRSRIGMTQQAVADEFACSRKHIGSIEERHVVPVVYEMAMRFLYSEKLKQYAEA